MFRSVGILKRAWRGAPRWAVVAALALLVLLGASACENADKAKLKALPVPQGSELERIRAPRVQLFGDKHIVYRVPMPREEAIVEALRVFEKEGWRIVGSGSAIAGMNFAARDGECVVVHVQWWVASTEFSSSDHSQLTLGFSEPETCGL